MLRVLVLAAAIAGADSWPGAIVTETFSANRDWFVRVTPGQNVGDAPGKPGPAPERNATAEWFERQPGGGYRVVARATLANPLAPVKTLVTDHGYLVALDNWHALGFGVAVASYRPDGTRVVGLTLAELYAKDEIEAFERSVSSIHWRSDTVYVRTDQRSAYVAGRRPGHELVLEPESGRWQMCEPRDRTQRCRTSNDPRSWGPYREPAGADAYLRSDLHALVRAGVRVGAVIGPQIQLQTTAPHLGPAATPHDRHGWIAWMGARWSDVLTVSDQPVVRVAAKTAVVCRAGLAQEIDASGIGGNATEVMFGIAKAIDPSLATLPPPGLLQGGGASRSPDKVVRDTAQLAGGRSSVESVLDQFVTRLDGWGWWVEERCAPGGRCACRVGMLTEDSVLSPIYDISPLASR